VRELTPPGRGGVSVLRLEGAGGRAAFARLVGADAARRAADGVPRLVRLIGAASVGARSEAAELLDVALAIDRGASGVELHVHGSPPLVRALAEAAGAAGAAGSTATDAASHESRALARLPRAACDAAARTLLDQAEGALRRELDRLVLAPPAAWRAGLEALAARARVARVLLEPPVVVLAGPVNAGKSTLFNALLGRRRVVESDEPGTTRDAIREPCLLGAYAVELVDTAGERALAEAEGPAGVEAAGQRLAGELARGAALVLRLDPDAAPPARVETRGAEVAGPPVVRLPARGDLARSGERTAAATGRLRPREAPLEARALVEDAFHAALGLPRAPWTPGAGVPLAPSEVAGLAALADVAPTASRRIALAELLGPRPLGSAGGEG